MKMNKQICILLSMLLLVSNISLAFDVHYCGDSIASISLETNRSNDNVEADCCGVLEKKASCCKDKVVKFEKKSDNFITKSYDFQTSFDFLIPTFDTVLFIAKSKFKNCTVPSYTCDANAPPIYKRNCQLVFYA